MTAAKVRERPGDKARRLLLEGRLTVVSVDPDRREAVVVVRGDHADHRIAFDPLAGWSCSCAAWRPDCSHQRAARLVVVVDVDDPGVAS